MRIVCDFKWGRIKSDEAGYVMIMAIFVMVIATLIGLSLAVMGINEYSLSENTKLMDAAYQIAEAGISRACVQIKNDPSIVSNTGGGAHNYPSNPPFWRSGSSTDDYTEPFGVAGWLGTYSVSIWQSELMTNNPTYKVLVSTGKLERGKGKGKKTAERTIEARIVAGASTQDYDASFDYMIYNGFYGRPWASPVVPQDDNGVWPNQTIFLGNFIFDGVSSYNGRSPKGVLYTRGSIDIPTKLLSGCVMHGNIVATNDITLSNSYGVTSYATPGVVIDNLDSSNNPVANQGNAVAGLDGTGTASLDVAWQAGFGVRPIKVSGYVAAANNVSVTNHNTFTWGGGSNQVGGIVAGGDVNVVRESNWVIGGSAGILLGNIFCAGKTTIKSGWSGGNITFDQISTGGDCYLETSSGGSISGTGAIYCGRKVGLATENGDISVGGIFAASPNTEAVNINADNANIITGDIQAQGSVYAKSTSWGVKTANITAGNDSTSPPIGITINNSGLGIDIGDLTAVGLIDVTSTGWLWPCNVGSVWSGGVVNLNAKSWFNCTVKDVSAYTDATVVLDLQVAGGITLGRVSANRNVNITGTSAIPGWSGFYLDGIKAGSNAVLNCNVSTTCYSLDPWGQGPGTPDNTWPRVDPLQAPFDPLQDPVHDAIATGGTVTTPGSGTITLRDIKKENLKVGLNPWIPGVDVPSVPDSPWLSGPSGGYPEGTERWLDPQKWPDGAAEYTGPEVNQSTLLAIAGLEAPVQLLEPNWQFFQDAATNDDAKNPTAKHILVDNSPGDADSTVGVYKFLWTDDKYSSNETIYQGDPNVNVLIDINWAGGGANFKGTLVTKGNVLVISNQTGGGWKFDSSQELNLVAGRDIRKDSSLTDFTWVTMNNMYYHFWARGDIDFTTKTFAAGTVPTFNGSFVCGNRLNYSDSYMWTISTWKWSRWSIDPAAWLPPFTVLSYKEI